MDHNTSPFTRSHAIATFGQYGSADWEYYDPCQSRPATQSPLVSGKTTDTGRTRTSNCNRSFSRWIDPEDKGLNWEGDLTHPRIAILPMIDSEGKLEFHTRAVFPEFENKPFEVVFNESEMDERPDTEVSHQITAFESVLASICEEWSRDLAIRRSTRSQDRPEKVVSAISTMVKSLVNDEDRLRDEINKHLGKDDRMPTTSQLQLFHVSVASADQINDWIDWTDRRAYERTVGTESWTRMLKLLPRAKTMSDEVVFATLYENGGFWPYAK